MNATSSQSPYHILFAQYTLEKMTAGNLTETKGAVLKTTKQVSKSPKPTSLKKHNDQSIRQIYLQALKEGRFDPATNKAVLFYDLDCLQNRLDTLSTFFPEQVLHAIAVKSQSHPAVLQYIAEAGFGLEAASIEEVKLAEAAGVDGAKIVFDSPVKTRDEIDYCHRHLPGIIVNANSLEELSRYPADFRGRLGLRINPLVSSDAPEILNVSQKRSKFGVPISRKDAIVDACVQNQKIEGLHFHIGSGIKDFSGNIEAVRRVYNLAVEINLLRKDNPLSFIDIGGGIDFDSATGKFSVESFAQEIQSQFPLMFQNFQVITEYGKFVHKYNCFAASKIEYVIEGHTKEETGTAFVHLGADLFLRKVYSSLDINYPYSILHQGDSTAQATYNIAGPLCFAGDFLYDDITVNKLNEGDVFFIHNIGANTSSMWSRHCSREEPQYVTVHSSKMTKS